MFICEMFIENNLWGIREDKMLSYISQERKNIIQKYHFNIDKKLSLYSELLIKMQLMLNYKIQADKVLFGKKSNGKPYLIGRKDCYFNLAHTRNAIICGLSDDELGIDIEKIDIPPYEIMKLCFSKEEIEIINRTPDDFKPEVFYKIWTRKESYGKRNGFGICQDLKKVNSFDDFLIPMISSWVEMGYCMSVCYTEKNPDIIKSIITEDEIFKFTTDYL